MNKPPIYLRSYAFLCVLSSVLVLFSETACLWHCYSFLSWVFPLLEYTVFLFQRSALCLITFFSFVVCIPYSLERQKAHSCQFPFWQSKTSYQPCAQGGDVIDLLGLFQSLEWLLVKCSVIWNKRENASAVSSGCWVLIITLRSQVCCCLQDAAREVNRKWKSNCTYKVNPKTKLRGKKQEGQYLFFYSHFLINWICLQQHYKLIF